MMKRVILALLYPSLALAQEPPPGGVCLTQEQKEILKKVVDELEEIKSSKAEIKATEPIIIVRDWQDRVFINGGEAKPIKLKLTLGKTIDRDMELTLPIQVHYREKPPDPMFRLRIRAQAGFLIPMLFEDLERIDRSVDAGIGWDIFHLDSFNFAINTGIRSAGAGVGIDVTKNFGFQGSYALVYSGFESGALVSTYFSFN
jgi:hypothetical protein